MAPRYILSIFLLFCTAGVAEARQRVHAACVETGDVMRPVCGTAQAPPGMTGNIPAGAKIRVTLHRERKARPQRAPLVSYGMPTTPWATTTLVDRARSYMAGIIAPLAAKISEIQAACGSKPISGMRHTYIAGTRHISLHASGKAVDMVGNPGCIYSLLQGWQGGYSTDYARMGHVHISYDPDGGREMGLRFRHGGGGHRYARHRHAVKYARRQHRHRYANAP